MWGGREPEEVWLNSQSGEKLMLWHFKPQGKVKGRVLYFHGNAQNISTHAHYLYWLVEEGFELLTFDYSGYGFSTGEPSPEKTYLDGVSFLQYGLAKSKKNIVYGQSLGGIILMKSLEEIEHKDRVNMIILDSTFDSYEDIAADKLKSTYLTYLLFPLGHVLMSDRYAPGDKFWNYRAPLLSIHFDQDRIVPFKFGERIFQKYQGPKNFWIGSGDKHASIFYQKVPKYRQALLDFIQSH